MCTGECLYCGRVLARLREQQLVERLGRRHRKDRRIDHRHAPILTIGRRDLQSHAAHPDHRIARLWIWGSEIEAPHGRILAAGEDLSLRELRAVPVCFKDTGETDALGVISPVAERHASG
jgi:hypothetical protein